MESPVAAMEVDEKHYLQNILSEQEISLISKDVINKLNIYLSEHIKPKDDEVSGCTDDGVNKEEIESKLIEITKNYEEAIFKLSAAEEQAKKVENLECDLNELKLQCSQIESEKKNLVLHCDKIIDEKNILQQLLKRRDNELQEYINTQTALSTQLKLETIAKHEAITLNREAEYKEKITKSKEMTMQEEKSVLNLQISMLTEQVNKLTSETQTLQIKCNNNEIYYEKKIQQLTDEFNLAEKSIAQLRETNTKLGSQSEDLSKKLLIQKELYNKMQCDYLKELNTKSKLADIYKMMNDESESKVFELKTGFSDLQKMLNEATEKYGLLESENRRLQVELEEAISSKEISLSHLVSELEHLNEQLKLSKDEKSQEILKYISPTAAIVNKLLKSELPLSQVYNELIRVSGELALEKERNKNMTNEFDEVVEEIAKSLPTIKKEQQEHSEMLQTNITIKHQLDSQILECKSLKKELNESVKLIKVHTREKSRLKREVTDLGKQVCYLLKEIEHLRGNPIPNGDYDPSHSFDDTPKDTITFGDIQELQRNNQKLLRQLNAMKGNDSVRSEDDINQILLLESKIADLTEELHHQSTESISVKQQRDMFKALYHENMSMTRNQSINDSNMIVEYTGEGRALYINEQKLMNTEQLLNDIKQEYKTFREKGINNEKLLYDQINKMRSEIFELTSVNCKHVTTAVHRNDQIKILNVKLEHSENIIENYKERNQNFRTSIHDYEMLTKKLNNDVISLQEQLASTQIQLKKMTADLLQLQGAEKQHNTEKNALQNEVSRGNRVLKEIKVLKTILENVNKVKYNKLEQELEESILNCTAVQKRLEEEHDRFRKLTLHLESEVSKAKVELLEERKISDILRTEISQLIQDRDSKEEKIKELKEKLDHVQIPNSMQGLPTNTSNSNLQKIFAEKDINIEKREIYISKLEHDLLICSKTCEQKSEDLKKLQSEYNNNRLNNELMISEYKQKIDSIQMHCCELEKLLEKQTNENKNMNTNFRIEMDSLNNKLQTALDYNKQCEEKCILSMNNAPKYTEQKITVDTIYESVIDRTDNLTPKNIKQQSEQDQNITKITENTNAKLNNVVEMNNKIKQQNNQLLETLHALRDRNNELSEIADSVLPPLKAVLTENPDDIMKEKLLTVDVTKKCELLQDKCSNLESQLKNTLKKLEDTKLKLEEKGLESLVDTTANIKQDDVLIKVEAIHAIIDSSKSLRKERDDLASYINELNDSVCSLQKELSSLQKEVKDLTFNNAALGKQNVMLEKVAKEWHNRADSLINNVNMASPEDWTQLKSECEHLSVQLCSEKEETKKLIKNLETIKMEKSKFEEKYMSMAQQYNTLLEDHKKLNENYQKNIAEVNSLTEKICTLKTEIATSLIQCDDLKLKLTKTEASLSDVREKEIQIKKIAKKYKQQYIELLQTVENDKKIAEEKKEEDQKTELQKITELQNQLEIKKAESEKSIADLKSSIQKEEKAKQFIKVAKNKIVHLTELKKKLAHELQEAQTTIETLQKSTDDDRDKRLALLKSQYDNKIARLEKEKDELKTEKAKEVDALVQKINQQRQLPSQISTSKQTADKTLTEAPPTANIKPMASCSGASTSNIRRSGETPLASIRPVAQVQCLVQPVHDAHSTEYMPASSSRPISRAAPPESTQDTNESQPPQQTVAMVIPRVEPQVAQTSGQSGVSTSNTPEQRAQKRPRPPPAAAPQLKKTRVDEEYQLPTSSQRDQDDEGVVIVESDEECTGTAYETRTGEEIEEVEADGQEMEAAEIAPEEPSGEVTGAPVPAAPQIEAISSGTEPSGALSLGVGDDGDDGIVPSTPTLYVPRRNDGFGEAVVSPLSGADATAVPSGARFTFAEAGEASHHDTHADLTSALPPSMPEDWAPAVTSNQTEPSQHSEENREAEATSQPTNEARPHHIHRRGSGDFRGRIIRGRGRGFRRPHGWMRF